MNILLDTCVFLWATSNLARLSNAAWSVLTDPANTLYLSVVSAWEISLKYSLGQLSLPQPPVLFVPIQRANVGVFDLPLTESGTLYLPNLPRLHKDPFDRMLICQAIVDGMTILTPDIEIQRYSVPTTW